MRPDKVPEAGQRNEPAEFIDDLSVAKQLYRGQTAYPEVTRQFRLFVTVDLGQLYFPGVFPGKLLQDRRQHPAGLAPGRPEIDQNRNVPGRLLDLDFKVAGGDFRNQGIFSHDEEIKLRTSLRKLEL